MAWIELHQGLPRHPKLIRLAARLGEDRMTAMGRLGALWLWAMEYAEDGNLKGFGAAEIAAAADWKGDAEDFIKALQECRWLDRMHLHDWMDYAGRLVEKRVANRVRMREKRASHVQRTTHARAGATVPNRTVPNRTQPTREDTAPRAPAPDAVEKEVALAKQNPIWDSLVATFGLKPTTRREQKELGRMVADYKEKSCSVEEIPIRADRYRRYWPTVDCNPRALLKHWDKFESEVTRGNSQAHSARSGKHGREFPEELTL